MSVHYTVRKGPPSNPQHSRLQWTRSFGGKGTGAAPTPLAPVEIRTEPLQSSTPDWFDSRFYFDTYPEARLECGQKFNSPQLYDFYVRVGRSLGHFPSDHSKRTFENLNSVKSTQTDNISSSKSISVNLEEETEEANAKPAIEAQENSEQPIEPEVASLRVIEPKVSTKVIEPKVVSSKVLETKVISPQGVGALDGLVLFPPDVDEESESTSSAELITQPIAQADSSTSDQTVDEKEDTLVRTSSGMNDLKLKRQTSRVFKPVVPNLLNLEQRARRLNFALNGVKPEVSILIVTYNRIDCTIACLESLALLREESAFEVLIWDNHSTDKTLPILKSIPGIQLFECNENLHFLRAVNGLAPKATAPYVVLLNNDAQIVPGTLAAAKDTLERIPKCAIVGAKIILRSSGRLQEAGSYFLNGGDPQGYGRNDHPKAPEYNFERPVPYCSGCFLMIRNSVFKELGYLDTRYVPAYFEETDLCVRALKQGYLIYYQPECVIIHEEGASASKDYEPSALMMANSKIFKQTHGEFLKQLPNNTLEARSFLPSVKNKRILWCESELPDPLKGSGYPRMAQILVWLVQQGWHITYHSIWGDRSLVSELPYGVEFILKNEMTLQQLISKRSNYYGTIIISRTPTMEAYRGIINQGRINGIPVLYDMETLAGLREIEKVKYTSTTSEMQAQKMLKADLDLCYLSSGVIVVSQPEKHYIINRGCLNVHLLGHIMEVPAKLLGSSPFEHRYGFLFIGFLDWEGSPNIDSINWFIDKIWPLILNAIPNASFGIIGQILPSLAERLSLVPGVRVYGAVDSNKIEELIAHHRVFVAPTRFASGIPHKCHTAASVGIPMVCTELLANQLGWDSTIAISAPCVGLEFADACIKLHRDEKLWLQIQSNAYAAVRRDCSFDQMYDFADWLTDMSKK